VSVHASLAGRAITNHFRGAPGIDVVESMFPGNLAIDRHTHDTGYACWTLAGSAVDTVDTREFSASPGYAYYVPPGTPHANIFGNSGVRCLLLEIDISMLDGLKELGCDITRPWAMFGGDSVWDGLALYRKLRNGSASPLDVETLVHAAFECRPAAPVKRSKPPAWLRRAREMLDAKLERPPRLATLAAEADVHPMHLIRVFRTQMGCSPGEYVQSRRIARACRLLLDSKVPLSGLALSLGYYDQSHFTRAFTSRVGVSPGAYRLTAEAR
jgi:AraC family transcriptional regulator